MESREGAIAVPPAWPALLALATVVLLSIVMLATDLVVEQRTAEETATLVGDVLRSVTLADRLRADAHVLAAKPPAAAAAAVTRQVAGDVAEYESLATYEGEHDEWARLQDLLARLQRAQTDADANTDALVADVEASVDRIVGINERQAAASVGAIHAVHRQAFTADAAAGGITVVLAIVVATALVRALRRQRVLVEARLEAERERRRELDAFAARVAHDLRGPLAPIRSYAELLCLGRVDGGPSPRDLGARIVVGTKRMTALIDDLLSLSVSGRPGAGQSDVGSVVTRVLDEVRPLPPDANVDVDVADARVACPPEALARLVHNLVSNAIKYRAPERPLAVTIRAARDGAAVELAVADNGVGMDPAAVARAFEPFYRVEATRRVPGHGLGLSIVKRTVDALGGTCAIASAPGGGTRVTLRLPAS